jgi:exonuclease III
MGSCNENILVWNVRGLNSRARWDAVRDGVRDEHVSILCLQETIMDVIPSRTILEMLGLDFDYSFLSAVGRSGGVLLAWRTTVWSVSDVHLADFSLTALV